MHQSCGADTCGDEKKAGCYRYRDIEAGGRGLYLSLVSILPLPHLPEFICIHYVCKAPRPREMLIYIASTPSLSFSLLQTVYPFHFPCPFSYSISFFFFHIFPFQSPFPFRPDKWHPQLLPSREVLRIYCIHTGTTATQDFRTSKSVRPSRKKQIKGTVQRDFNSVFWHLWIGLGLNKDRFWFKHFSEAPMSLDRKNFLHAVKEKLFPKN